MLEKKYLPKNKSNIKIKNKGKKINQIKKNILGFIILKRRLQKFNYSCIVILFPL